MYTFLVVILIAVCVLGISELVRRKFNVPNEDARKTYHIVHALVVGISPFLIPYSSLIVLELLLLATMLVVRRYKLLGWLYEVGRISWGDLFGVIGVVVISLMQPNKWVFLAAMLHLGIADALAALIGKKYGRDYQFRVFGQIKSIPGSLAFLIASITITTLVIVVSQTGQGTLAALLILPILITLSETVSPYGIDNFVIPIVVVLTLDALRFTA